MLQDEFTVEVDVDAEIILDLEIPTIDLHVKSSPDILVVAAGGIGNPGPQGPQGPLGPTGATGATGPTGPTGPQGSTGTGILMKGSVATVGALPPTGNTQGDAYIVQADDSLHVWNGTAWISGGSIQGPPGANGATGPTGATGPQGPQGIPGTAGATGATGAAGSPGATGPAGPGVPAGGTTGQMLAKSSGADYATAWIPQPAGGGVDYIGNWAAPTAYKKGDVVRYNGNDYMAVNDSTGVTPPAPAAIYTGGASVGTSLPSSPFDGQEAILVDSLTAPTYQWRFKYLASITDANKWLYIGGAPALVVVDTAEATTSATYVALTTAGPNFAIPRAGIWDIEIGFMAYKPSGNGSIIVMSYDIGGTGASDTDSVQATNGTLVVSGTEVRSSSMRPRRKTLSAVTLTSKYRSANTEQGGFANRWMRATPVRIS